MPSADDLFQFIDSHKDFVALVLDPSTGVSESFFWLERSRARTKGVCRELELYAEKQGLDQGPIDCAL